jgi:hypothetical protein
MISAVGRLPVQPQVLFQHGRPARLSNPPSAGLLSGPGPGRNGDNGPQEGGYLPREDDCACPGPGPAGKGGSLGFCDPYRDPETRFAVR